MARSPVDLRAAAAHDIELAVDHYLTEAGVVLALKFIDAFEHTLARISRAPLVGTLRFSYELGIPDLRAWPLRGFPHLIFYVPEVARVDVWRVLHSRRDLPAEMAEGIDDA
ncbi:MAG: type II toxin-antitoxin system RelE/ParE family toxin [Actinomycetia bacterium]|nr:type II toxin-antitoxin system RelE/ParE family toxin [Actinomycetes bacterium]